MPDITLFGFPHSSFVHIVQLVLAHKEAPYTSTISNQLWDRPSI